MNRYKALALRTDDMGFIEPHLTNEWGTYDVYLASDVDELQDRYREAVELLTDAQHGIGGGWTSKVRAFLALEEVSNER